jgi:ABC-type phosphate transport system substrate-binding protein
MLKFLATRRMDGRMRVLLCASCLLAAASGALGEEPVLIAGGHQWGLPVLRDIVVRYGQQESGASEAFRLEQWADRACYKRFCEGGCQILAHYAAPGVQLNENLPVIPEGGDGVYEIGYAKVLVIVHPRNPVGRLTLDQLRDALRMRSDAPTWKSLGGTGGAMQCYGAAGWASVSGHVVRRSCMLIGGDYDGAFYAFRKDLQECRNAEEVIEKVRSDLDGLGFLLYDPQQAKLAETLRMVRILAVGKTSKGPFITPELTPLIQRTYPLLDPLILYVHPNAPPMSRGLCELAASEAGARIAARYGLLTPWHEHQYAEAERLKELRAGKGTRITALGFGTGKGALPELAVEYVRAKQVLQLTYASLDSDVAAVGAFVVVSTSLPASGSGAGGKELLFLADKPSARAMELHGKQWNALGRDSAGKPNGAGPAEYLLAGRAAAVIVNPANKIDVLTIGQLQAVFGGEVADWGTLGGAGLATSGHGKSQIGGSQIKGSQNKGSQIGGSEIRAIGLRSDDLATGIFEKECLERAKWKRVAIKNNSAEVLAAVSMDPQAIGFVDLAGIPATGQNVRILGIRLGTASPPPAPGATSPVRGGGVAAPPPAPGATSPRGGGVYYPSPENIRSAMYPLSQRLWMYVHPQASDTARDFVKFIATCGAGEASPYADTVKAVMDTYRKNGLVPLADAALLRMTKDAMAEDAARTKAGKKK